MNARKSRRAQRGMTLIEIMVVLVILGLIASAVAVNVVGRLADARIDTAKNDVRKISDGIDTYKVLKGHFPSSEEGLGVLIKENILKANKNGRLEDPWGHEYVYLYPGQTHTDSYDVKSYGADGQPGGDGENADVVNP